MWVKIEYYLFKTEDIDFIGIFTNNYKIEVRLQTKYGEKTIVFSDIPAAHKALEELLPSLNHTNKDLIEEVEKLKERVEELEKQQQYLPYVGEEFLRAKESFNDNAKVHFSDFSEDKS